MSNALIPYEPELHNVVVARNQALMDLRDKMFRKGLHYGEPFKGSGKPTLLKPGAEIILARFALWPEFIDRGCTEKWDDPPIFHYRYECRLRDRETDEVWGAGIGSCNSMEDKYRWRKVARVCPECGKETIIKGRAEYGGGWLCYRKKGGCGAKWQDGAEIIESQEEGKAPNDEVYTLVNTIDKMAQKRALVAAVLVATGASTFFTQDVEDFPGYAGEIIDADYDPITGEVDAAETPPHAPTSPQGDDTPEPGQPQQARENPLPMPEQSEASELDDYFGPRKSDSARSHIQQLMEYVQRVSPDDINEFGARKRLFKALGFELLEDDEGHKTRVNWMLVPAEMTVNDALQKVDEYIADKFAATE